MAKSRDEREEMFKERKKVYRQSVSSGKKLREEVIEEYNKAKKVPVVDYPVSLAGMITKVANMQLPVPGPVTSLPAYQWPLEITAVPITEVRNLISYYSAQVAYANVQLGKLKFLLSKVEFNIRSRTRKIRAKYSGKLKVAEISGIIEDDKLIVKLENSRLHAQGVYDMVEGLRNSYQVYVTAASREMSVRQDELRSR